MRSASPRSRRAARWRTRRRSSSRPPSPQAATTCGRACASRPRTATAERTAASPSGRSRSSGPARPGRRRPPQGRLPPRPRLPDLPARIRQCRRASSPSSYRILAFTETTAEYEDTESAAVEALRAAGRKRHFSVNVADDSSEFTDKNLASYRAVVFLNTAGDVLTDAQQAAFEHYFSDGGGFVGIHSRDRDRARLGVPDRPARHPRRRRRVRGREPATIKVADRVHDASKDAARVLAAHGRATTTSPSNVRGLSHVLATVDETTYTGGTMGFDHPVAWCKDYQGGRSFYTGAGAHRRDLRATPNFREHLGGAIQWAAGQSDPVYSDCGATVLANYQQTKISAPPNLNEPIGFDQLPDGRVDPDRPRAARCACTTRRRRHDRTLTRARSRSTPTARTACTARRSTTTSPPTSGSTSTTRRRRHGRRSTTAVSPTDHDPDRPARPTTPRPTRAPGTRGVGYFQLSRFKFVDAAAARRHAGPGDRAEDHEGRRSTAARAATSPATSTSTSDNNLWLVTGDDTPAGGGNSGGFRPHNDHEDQRDPDRRASTTPRAARSR